MKGVDFEQSNLKLRATEKTPNTYDLIACRAVDTKTNMPFVIAKFKADKEELKRIQETGEVWICIMGNGWPPILPTPYNPFDELGFVPNEGGLPVMKYREEVEKMLRRVYFQPEYMNDEYWKEFLKFMGEKFNFVELGEQLDRGVKNGFGIEDQLEEAERIMRKIMSKEQALKFREN